MTRDWLTAGSDLCVTAALIGIALATETWTVLIAGVLWAALTVLQARLLVRAGRIEKAAPRRA